MAANATRTRLMQIGEIARQTGVSIKALHFYDRLGLLLIAGRSPANYRLFGEEAVLSIVSVDAPENFREAFCEHVNFFRSPEAARPWLERHPDAQVLPVHEGFAVGKALAQVYIERAG